MADIHVRRSGDDYAEAFLELLPDGQAWPRHPDSTLSQACNGISQYWGYVDGRAADLLETESDPRATTELLPDWERNWGLPEPCIKDFPTDYMQRRLLLVQKMTLLGAQSRDWFIGVAAKLGYTITISEYAPYMCGVSFVGDSRGYDIDAPAEDYRWEVGPPEIRYYWTVHVSALRLIYFHCNSSQCGIDRLLTIYGPEDLECIFDRWKPAHTVIVYDFSQFQGLDYTVAANTQYLPMGIP
jgi:uncharacterized protein YmfQ (DUF2313 family)